MGSSLGMTPIYARSQKGKRAYGTMMKNRGANFSVLGILSREKAIRPMVIKGPVDKSVFLTFINRVLIPNLQVGQVVIMDNLSVHKVKEVRESIEKAGCKLIYQPPYCPMVFVPPVYWVER